MAATIQYKNRTNELRIETTTSSSKNINQRIDFYLSKFKRPKKVLHMHRAAFFLNVPHLYIQSLEGTRCAGTF